MPVRKVQAVRSVLLTFFCFSPIYMVAASLYEKAYQYPYIDKDEGERLIRQTLGLLLTLIGTFGLIVLTISLKRARDIDELWERRLTHRPGCWYGKIFEEAMKCRDSSMQQSILHKAEVWKGHWQKGCNADKYY